MGASIDEGRTVETGKEGRFRISLKISPEELETLQTIVQERASFKNPYLCSVERLLSNEGTTSNMFCENFKEVLIEYEPYDYLLSHAFKSKPFPQIQIQKIIFSVCSALLFLFQKKYRHGDIQLKSICCHRGDWKLLDNYFIKGGITAYEKVLEGEDGFISPSQMQKIRHGFVRESPIIQQSDEVFGLGMTCLELMSGRPSKECYKQSYIRYNQKSMNEAISLMQQNYPPYFSGLVQAMLNMNEEKRILIRDIIGQPFINRHSKKYSLRPMGRP